MSVAATDARYASSALRLAGFSAGLIRKVRLLGVDAHLLVDVDRDELDRRVQHATPAITDREILRTLAGLPHGVAVRVEALSPYALEVLSEAPTGVVGFNDGKVTRQLRSAVRLRCAAVVDKDWKRGLDNASVFAAFCPRILVLTALPANVPWVTTEASYDGIGLVFADNSKPWLAVVPDTAAPRLGPVSWRVAEEALVALGGPSGLSGELAHAAF